MDARSCESKPAAGRRAGRGLAGWVLGMALAQAAPAAVLMDQIGPNGSFQEGLSNIVTQSSNFYASASQFDISVVDDFTLDSSATLGAVEVALFASNANAGANGFGQLSALRVNLYSSQPGASAVHAGDVLSSDTAIGSVVFTTPWTSSPLTRLARIDLSARNLQLAPGTYWLSVTALNNSFSTDIGVLMSNFAGTPGNDNARQIGSTLWGGGGNRALGADAALRVTGDFAAVPLPAPAALLGLGLGVLGMSRRRRG